MKEEWTKGEEYPPENDDKNFAACINVGRHGDAIACYGLTAEEAAERRDMILRAVAALQAQ